MEFIPSNKATFNWNNCQRYIISKWQPNASCSSKMSQVQNQHNAHRSPDHQASWLNGGLIAETKRSAACVLSLSSFSHIDTNTFSSLKERESIQLLLKLTLLNSLHGGLVRAEDPSRLNTNSTSTIVSFFEPDSRRLWALSLLFSMFLLCFACLSFEVFAAPRSIRR